MDRTRTRLAIRVDVFPKDSFGSRSTDTGQVAGQVYGLRVSAKVPVNGGESLWTVETGTDCIYDRRNDLFALADTAAAEQFITELMAEGPEGALPQKPHYDRADAAAVWEQILLQSKLALRLRG